MKSTRYVLRELIFLIGCLLTLTISLYFDAINSLSIIVTFSILFILSVVDIKERALYPVIFTIALVKLLQIPIEIFVAKLSSQFVLSPFIYYLSSAFLDVFMIFAVSAYANDEFLQKLFKVSKVRPVPHTYFMIIILGCSAIYACAQAVEWLVYFLDHEAGGKMPFLFNLNMPLFYSFQNEVKFSLKLMFDLVLWSLLLEPERWKILDKISSKRKNFS